jgi:putative NIF3 family GTP cyclohydrolase 1 type 2
MHIKDIINFLEIIAPSSLQEDYDNAGLITGSTAWIAAVHLFHWIAQKM